MQQFKTYPGIPPSGVVERPSVLRIPPRPAWCPPASYWEFRSYKVVLWAREASVLADISV